MNCILLHKFLSQVLELLEMNTFTVLKICSLTVHVHEVMKNLSCP